MLRIASRADRLNMRRNAAKQGRPPGETDQTSEMGLLARLLGARPEAVRPLYDAIVARARAPCWYVDGAVPDTIDGRFDMVAAVLSLVLLRLEDAPEGAEPAARLAEAFIADMDGQLRQIGIGDIIVGKHIGRMMGMLGGRLGAYRDGLAAGDIGPALVRNIYRGETPDSAALAHVRDNLIALHATLREAPVDSLVAGALPA
jgi:cytochrome b pre-mRNA-processing protein 3